MALAVYYGVLADNGDYSDYSHGIILDAGSSGTKLKIYRWKRLEYMFQLPDIYLIKSYKHQPSITVYNDRVIDLAIYLDDIIQVAKDYVPLNLYSDTPIYLMATAGFRELNEQKAKQIMDNVINHLSRPDKNPFTFEPRNVKILSGEEEGVYAWIAVNYLRGRLHPSMPPSHTHGILEMGGGSTQIAFHPTVPIYAGKYQVRLFGRVYGLYTHSYLMFGQIYLRDRINKFLYRKYNSTDVKNPCMLKGDSKVALVYNKPVNFTGSGNPQKCLRILEPYLRKADYELCSPKPCAIGSVYQPPVQGVIFFALSAFIYVAQELHAVDSESRMDVGLLERNAHTYCQKTIGEILATSTEISEQFASGNCMMGLYIPLLLTRSYGFSKDTKNIFIKKEIHGRKIDWALGAMLSEVDLQNVCKVNGGQRTFLSSMLTLVVTLCTFIRSQTNCILL